MPEAGITAGEHHFKDLAYADDVVIFLPNEGQVPVDVLRVRLGMTSTGKVTPSFTHKELFLS